jgi:2-oxoglutarate dehydrogenase E2 component (dihydrolipoamide succinyltransferase)
MAKIELLLPSMGEGIIEATITRWLVAEGDKITEDQPILEVATDKVDSEIPSPVDGIVGKIVMKEGEVPAVGDLLAILETGKEAESIDREEVTKEVERITGKKEEKSLSGDDSVPSIAAGSGTDRSHVQNISRQTRSGKFLTPLVRSIAKRENVSSAELDNMTGSGDGGRITRNDIMDYISKRSREKTPTPSTPPEVSGQDDNRGTISQGVNIGEGDRRVEMDRMRKIIAGHMVASKQISPHVTSFIDVDVTGLVKWREARKQHFLERENQKLTYTPVFIEATAKALKDFPMVNISVDGESIIIRKNINIGMAVALPEGNLIVPVIRNADEKNITGLVRAVNDLAHRARNRKLQPGETSGGTFTITNFGTFRNTTGTPIINQPEVAILGAGAIVKKPVVIETGDGDMIAIRNIMTLSLSYDHRVVDGALGGMFLRRIAEYLENFDPSREV